MKVRSILAALLVMMMLPAVSFSQDKRTLETKIADLVAQFPVNDLVYLDKLMNDMSALGEEGLARICDQVIPAGTGDDTRFRFAVESYSRFVSGAGRDAEKQLWEKICISAIARKADPGIRDFFMKQLQLTGSDKTAEALKMLIADKENCSAAISAIASVGGRTAEQILAESLKEKDLPCAAAIMNALAGMNSALAVNEYIVWAKDASPNTKAAAYNALARSGSPFAYPVLLEAARSLTYRWDRTGATNALLDYAIECGKKGDVKTADRIFSLLMNKCNDKLNIQYKTAALQAYTDLYGISAMPEILKAASHPDNKFRNAAINMSASLDDPEVVKLWIRHYGDPEHAGRPRR
ncbi:MAG: HEAT repeat domain-containing protein [Bacteroidales bacterium]|nr:HEAT repeat domain-containing protein [Bacteroidales bacterium]